MGTDHTVLSDGLRVSYREAGDPDGPAVMYLHGTPGSRMQVTGPVSTVASALGLRIIAPDRPGYGGSSFVPYRVVDYPAMIARLADSLGIDRFGVLGTSGGGRYAYSCGMVLKDRVRRVALVASTAPSDPARRSSDVEQVGPPAVLDGHQSPVVPEGLDGKDCAQVARAPGADAGPASGHVDRR